MKINKVNIFASIFVLVAFLSFVYLLFFYQKSGILGENIPIYKEKLKQDSPEVIFVGNSMVNDNIDNQLFEEVSGINSKKLKKGGLYSPFWYLVLKNIIISSLNEGMDKPKMVLFFFRDYNIVNIHSRTYGKFKERLDRFATSDEALLNKKIYSTDFFTKNFFREYENNKESLRGDLIAKYLRYLAYKIWMQFSPNPNNPTPNNEFEAASYYFHKSFANKRVHFGYVKEFNKDLLMKIIDEDQFDSNIQNSLLSDIIDLAKQNNLEIAFVRVKRYYDQHLKDDEQSRKVDKFILALKEYLAKEEIPLIDFSNNTDLGKEHFADNDGHLNIEGKKLFTKLLAEKIKKLIK